MKTAIIFIILELTYSFSWFNYEKHAYTYHSNILPMNNRFQTSSSKRSTGNYGYYTMQVQGSNQENDGENSPRTILHKAQEAVGGVMGSVFYPESGDEKGGVTMGSVVLKFPQNRFSPSSPYAWFFDHNHWGLLEFSGEDRLRFLHGQCTNAIETARPGMVLEATITTNLGRAVDLCKIAILPDRCLLLCSPNRKGALLERFEKLIFPADKVQMKEVSGLAIFTLAGKGNISSEVLENVGITTLPKENSYSLWTQVNGKKALVLAGSTVGGEWEGFTLLVPWASAPDLYGSLGWWAHYAGEEEWQTLRILQGRPFPGKELTKDYNALEAGLFHTVHFNKGCFVGQETLAKVNNAKKLKLQLFGVHFPKGSKIEGNMTLETEDGTRAGIITSVIQSADMDSEIGLAFIRSQAGTASGIKVVAAGIAGITVDVPYPTRSDEQAAQPPKRAQIQIQETSTQDISSQESERIRKAKKLEEMQKRLDELKKKKQKKMM